MSEVFWNHLEEQNKEIDTNISSFNDVENNLKNIYEKNKKLEWAKNLALKQYIQQQELKEQKEKPILQEAKEWLDKQAMINEVKTMLYEKLWLDNNIKNNNSFENFEKWIVDALVLDNYDLAIQVYETNWKIILDWLTQLASFEWLKQIAKAIWESIWTIWDWNAYEKWKAVADLWLIWTWIWATTYVWKKSIKFWMKEASKFRRKVENTVSNPDTKKVIWDVNTKVNEIVPKKELDFEKLANKNIDIKRQIDWLKELGIPESFSRDMLESWLLNKEFLWWDLLRRFKALDIKWIDYNKMIDNAIKNIQNLTKEDALLIFSYTDNILYKNLNWYMRWSLDIVDNMSPENIQATNKIISKLEQAVKKMPNLKPWKDWFILRWDKWKWWQWKIWDNIELKSFTSVSNNKNDIFIWKIFNNDTQILIIWKEWKIKDISSLAIAVNFWDKLKWITKTSNEWLILSNSTVKIIWRNIKKEWTTDINEITVKQTK